MDNILLVSKIKDLVEAARLDHTCVTCVHFTEKYETCYKAGGVRPPARIIASGCPAWEQAPPF